MNFLQNHCSNRKTSEFPKLRIGNIKNFCNIESIFPIRLPEPSTVPQIIDFFLDNSIEQRVRCEKRRQLLQMPPLKRKYSQPIKLFSYFVRLKMLIVQSSACKSLFHLNPKARLGWQKSYVYRSYIINTILQPRPGC